MCSLLLVWKSTKLKDLPLLKFKVDKTDDIFDTLQFLTEYPISGIDLVLHPSPFTKQQKALWNAKAKKSGKYPLTIPKIQGY
jgi:hypothetical protein